MDISVAVALGLFLVLMIAASLWRRAGTTSAGKGMDMTPSPAEALRTPGRAHHRKTPRAPLG